MMRLILRFLALAQVPLSAFDMARSDLLARQADEAMMRAEDRLSLAHRLAMRSRVSST